MTGNIFEIKRFAVHDGDGIRTTVFFKGCPLRCVWCHNPEGLSTKQELGYYAHKCVNCGECVINCKSSAHSFDKEKHIFEAEKCISCGACVEGCCKKALCLFGKNVTVEELLPILLEDKDFYKESGGGVTLSGGECLMQANFCAELLKKLKENGISTAVDTSGAAPTKELMKVIPYTDIFLYDIKAYDEDVHIKCTGKTNKQIFENLKCLEKMGKCVEIRVPYVPGYNDGQMEKIARFLSEFKCITKARIIPYHNFAGSKYLSLNKENKLPCRLPTSQELDAVKKLFISITNFPIS